MLNPTATTAQPTCRKCGRQFPTADAAAVECPICVAFFAPVRPVRYLLTISIPDGISVQGHRMLREVTIPAEQVGGGEPTAATWDAAAIAAGHPLYLATRKWEVAS